MAGYQGVVLAIVVEPSLVLTDYVGYSHKCLG